MSLVFGAVVFFTEAFFSPPFFQEPCGRNPRHRGRQPDRGRQRQDAAGAAHRRDPEGARLEARHRLARLSGRRSRRGRQRADPSGDHRLRSGRGGRRADAARAAQRLPGVGGAGPRGGLPRAARAASGVRRHRHRRRPAALRAAARRRDLRGGRRGFGNGFLQPAGPLREPRSRLRSVDAVVAHGRARTCRATR